MYKILQKVLCGALLISTGYANQLSFQEQFPAPPARTCNTDTAIACVPVQVDKNTKRCEVQFLGEFLLSEPYVVPNNQVDYSASYSSRINGRDFNVRCWRPSNMDAAQTILRRKIGMLPKKFDACNDDAIEARKIGHKYRIENYNGEVIKNANGSPSPIDIDANDMEEVRNTDPSAPLCVKAIGANAAQTHLRILNMLKISFRLVEPVRMSASASAAVPLPDAAQQRSDEATIQTFQHLCGDHSKPCKIQDGECFVTKDIKIPLSDKRVVSGDKYKTPNGKKYGCISKDDLKKIIEKSSATKTKKTPASVNGLVLSD